MSEKIKINFFVRILALILLIVHAVILYYLFVKTGSPNIFSVKNFLVLFVVAISISPLAYVVIKGESSNKWLPKWKNFF